MEKFLIEVDLQTLEYECTDATKTFTLVEAEDHAIFIQGVALDGNSYTRDKQILINSEGCLKGLFVVVRIYKSRVTIETDHLASRRLYTSMLGRYLIISNNPLFISDYIKEKGGSPRLNEEAALTLLAIGYLPAPLTMIAGVNSLEPNSVYTFTSMGESSVSKPFEDYSSLNYTPGLLHEKFHTAVLRIGNYVKTYNKDAFFYLSGGLDSRYTVLCGHEQGWITKTLTFGQSGCQDISIANDICSNLGIAQINVPLGNGDYLKNVSKYFECSAGQVSYIGAAHLQYAVETLGFEELVAVTGLIGDAVFGSYTKKFKAENYIYSQKAYEKTSVIKLRFQRYKTSEEYIFDCKAPFAAINGDYCISDNVESYSPFMDPDLYFYCRDLEPNLKRDQGVYFDLINSKYPKLGTWVWQKTGFRPVNKNFSKICSNIKWLVSGILRRLSIKTREDMNPFNFWIRNSSALKEFIMEYDSFDYPEEVSKELVSLLREELSKENSRRKFNSITCIEAIKRVYCDSGWK